MSSTNLQAERIIASSAPEAAHLGVADGIAAAAPRILVVDDVADNRAILLRRFQRHGFEVTEADSGLKALELIGNHEFDLVLLDWMMPGIDGLETLRRIRSQRSASIL